jgi:hypothetical protein
VNTLEQLFKAYALITLEKWKIEPTSQIHQNVLNGTESYGEVKFIQSLVGLEYPHSWVHYEAQTPGELKWEVMSLKLIVHHPTIETEQKEVLVENHEQSL